MSEATPEDALKDIKERLEQRGVEYALVGGLAVSLRAEVRFTRDVDIAIAVASDEEVEKLVYALRSAGYVAIALVEHEQAKRLATVRLASPSGIVVDLLAASSGIEGEIVQRATKVPIEGAGAIPVARAEDLLAMKVLSMTDQRLQDRIDGTNLILMNEDLDLAQVRANLRLITERGFDRRQDLFAKLDDLLRSTGASH